MGNFLIHQRTHLGPTFPLRPSNVRAAKCKNNYENFVAGHRSWENKGKLNSKPNVGNFPSSTLCCFPFAPQLARCLLLFIGYLLASFQRFFFYFRCVGFCFHVFIAQKRGGVAVANT